MRRAIVYHRPRGRCKRSSCPRKAGGAKAAIPQILRPAFEGGISMPVIVIDDAVATRFIDLINGDPEHECGALLFGNVCRDRVTGATIAFVEDMYTDGTYGTHSDYCFTADMQIDALHQMRIAHGKTKHIIGTAHSHAIHDAFFSAIDYRMMETKHSDEVHMVLSPSHNSYVITFKDVNGVFHEASMVCPEITGKYKKRRGGNHV